MTLDRLTDRLTEVYRSGQRNRFVERAHHVLSGAPVAPRLAELTLRALLELGLGGPARELFQLRSDLKRGGAPQFGLQAALAEAPNGRVRWTECQPVWHANIAALLRHRPHLHELVESLPRLLADVHLHRTADGHHHISRRSPGCVREWLLSLTSEDDEAMRRLPPRGKLGPTAVVGVRIGPALERVYEDTGHLLLSYGHPLYVLEPDPVRFAAWLHCGDHRKLLDDERVYFFVGEHAVDLLAELLAAQPNLAIPVVYVDQSETALGATVSIQVRDAAEALSRRREAELTRCRNEIERRYRDRDAAYWAARFHPPGAIMGITSRFTTVLQYSTRDALQALSEMGHETHVLIEDNDHHQLSRLETCRKILELDPVMVLSLDHLRYESPHLPDNLPMLTWIQDPMANLLCRRAGESLGPFDFVCGYFRDRCVAEFGYPQDAFLSTGIPVSTRVFHDGAVEGQARDRYACDICFVSNASEPIERIYESFAATHPPAYRPLLQLVYRRSQEILGRDECPMEPAAADLVRRTAAETGLALDAQSVQHLSTYFAYRLLDWGSRQRTLEWVAEWARRTGRVFKIYGRGWDAHPTLGEFAAGIVEHGEPLRRAYRAARLALQLVPGGFDHQRSYELLAAGTLPLVRYSVQDFDGLSIEAYVQRRDAGEQLRGAAGVFPGLERIVFRNRQEFECLAEGFLADETCRRRVRTELRDVVVRRYTYAETMRRVMKAFQRRLRRMAARSRHPGDHASAGRPDASPSCAVS